jgi:hypothetical protein
MGPAVQKNCAAKKSEGWQAWKLHLGKESNRMVQWFIRVYAAPTMEISSPILSSLMKVDRVELISKNTESNFY